MTNRISNHRYSNKFRKPRKRAANVLEKLSAVYLEGSDLGQFGNDHPAEIFWIELMLFHGEENWKQKEHKYKPHNGPLGPPVSTTTRTELTESSWMRRRTKSSTIDYEMALRFAGRFRRISATPPPLSSVRRMSSGRHFG